MNTDPFTAAWTNQLLEYQRQYQDAWYALASPGHSISAARGEASNANPWVAALEQWWKAVQPGTTSQVQDFYSKLVEQGKVYFKMTDGLNKAFQQAAVAGDSAARWQEGLADTLSGLKEIFSGPKPNAQGAAHQAIAFWELPLNTWQRAVSSSSVLPGDFLRDGSTLGMEQVRDQLHGRVDQLLSTPTIGYMREHQEQAQILAKLSIDYQQALQDYGATYGEIGVKCVESLQQDIQRRMVDGKSIESLRELYDLWVDSCEQAYSDYVSTDQYVEIYGRLVNSLMALKRHGTMMVDEAMGAANMPTRSEIDTLHRRLQEARRDGKALRAEVQSVRKSLQAEIKALKGALLARDGNESNRQSKVNLITKRRRAAASKKTVASEAAKTKPRPKRKQPSTKRS